MTTPHLPHWDMTPFYPGLDSAEFEVDFKKTATGIAELTNLFHEITDHSEQNAADLERLLILGNDIIEVSTLVGTYIECFITTDSQDALAQAKMSEFNREMTPFSQLWAQITAWIGTLDIDVLLNQSPALADYEFLLWKTKEQSRHLMSPAEENLAVELNLTGAEAWSRLHGDISSQISVKISLPPSPLQGNTPPSPLQGNTPHIGGEIKELPMSAVRHLAYDNNREVRRIAYEAELNAWEANKVVIAASINSIKGQVNTLSRRRDWDSPLSEALFGNNIDRESLDAMMAAAKGSFPDFRRYLNTKAKALKIEKMAWYDLFAPIESDSNLSEGTRWEWDNAKQFIIDNFATYSHKLSDYAARAFQENWIDAEPRAGKRDGAFCASVRGDESRILANFKPSFNGVTTLAHELGHGYHNICLSEKPGLLRTSPMTLAETASIFCETIIKRAGLAAATDSEKIGILEASLQGSCQIVVDITSRFLFEQNVFSARGPRELSPNELCELMLQAQKDTYGDGLDMNARHPYMWAVKPHYYSTASFYNYPYMFGMLFGLGLYARYQAEPEAFKRSYDSLLGSTGCADAATLANRFGIDIRSQDFWNGSLDIIRDDIRMFEELCQEGNISGE